MSWGIETPKKFTESEIRKALETLDTGAYGAVLRAKGIVPNAEGGWIHFDMVPGEFDVRSSAVKSSPASMGAMKFVLPDSRKPQII